MDQNMHDGGGGDGSVSTIQQESNKNSNGSVRVGYCETVVPSVESGSLNGENGNLDVKGNSGLGPSKNLEGHEINTPASGKHSCVIDVKGGGGENCDGERICRICHLSYQDDPDGPKTELILLGCGCKDDLGSAHVHCAEAWFKLKGNRLFMQLLNLMDSCHLFGWLLAQALSKNYGLTCQQYILDNIIWLHEISQALLRLMRKIRL